MDRTMDRHDRIIRWKDADGYRVHRHERILRWKDADGYTHGWTSADRWEPPRSAVSWTVHLKSRVNFVRY
jgi:hypothetical protein